MVGSVVNAIAILRYMSSAPPQGVNAIARAVSLNPSSCFNLLKTLAQEAFLQFDPQSKTYRSGPLPSWMGQTQMDTAAWGQWLRGELEELAREYSTTCGVWQLVGDRLILIEVVETLLDTRIHLRMGQRLPSHIGAMGRCVAAQENLSITEVAYVIAQLRWQNPPTAKGYMSDMRAAARQGWAVDAGRFLRGVTTVGAPIRSPGGKIGYCLTSTLFSGQCDTLQLQRLGASTASLAREAARRLYSSDN